MMPRTDRLLLVNAMLGPFITGFAPGRVAGVLQTFGQRDRDRAVCFDLADEHVGHASF
jgi:hypothetical protein